MATRLKFQAFSPGQQVNIEKFRAALSGAGTPLSTKVYFYLYTWDTPAAAWTQVWDSGPVLASGTGWEGSPPILRPLASGAGYAIAACSEESIAQMDHAGAATPVPLGLWGFADSDLTTTAGPPLPAPVVFTPDALGFRFDVKLCEDWDVDGVFDCSGDCDDVDPATYTGAPEQCDGVDNDCDGVTPAPEVDSDGDLWMVCDADCDDANPMVNPGAAEACDMFDTDCDGVIPPNELLDADADGHLACADCDDADASVHPGAIETCNAVDEDCDAVVDDGLDPDGDGVTSCGVDGTQGTPDDDCAPFNATRYPGAAEFCDGIDQDCDMGVDEDFDLDVDAWTTCLGDCDDGSAATFPGATDPCDGVDQDCGGTDGIDFDGDGFPALCGPSADCTDTNPLIHPAAVELCNALDDDCDGNTDNPADLDGDGFHGCNGDCDDADATRHPGAFERCDATDSDCDLSEVDDYLDEDADGHPDCIGMVLYADVEALGWSPNALANLNAAIALTEPISLVGGSAATPCELAQSAPGSSVESDALLAALAEFGVDTSWSEDFESYTASQPCDDWSVDSSVHGVGGSWVTAFAGGAAGTGPCSASDARGAWVEEWGSPGSSSVLRQRPQTPSGPQETFSTLVLSGAAETTDVEWSLFEVEMGTVQQNRVGQGLPPGTPDASAPNAWEMAWISWRHSWDDVEPTLVDDVGNPLSWGDFYEYSWDLDSNQPGVQAPCEDGQRFYYFILQSAYHNNEPWPGTWELGKYGPEQNTSATGDASVCNKPLATGLQGYAPTIRATTQAQSSADLNEVCVWSWGDRTEVWVDLFKLRSQAPPSIQGLRSFVDLGGLDLPAEPAAGEPVSTVLGAGAFGLYNEDASVVFDNVAILGDAP